MENDLKYVLKPKEVYEAKLFEIETSGNGIDSL
jgi:hypothetical protein